MPVFSALSFCIVVVVVVVVVIVLVVVVVLVVVSFDGCALMFVGRGTLSVKQILVCTVGTQSSVAGCFLCWIRSAKVGLMFVMKLNRVLC